MQSDGARDGRLVCPLLEVVPDLHFARECAHLHRVSARRVSEEVIGCAPAQSQRQDGSVKRSLGAHLHRISPRRVSEEVIGCATLSTSAVSARVDLVPNQQVIEAFQKQQNIQHV